MEAKYVRDEMNSEISMGEVSLLCDEKILDKNVMSRIITSTLLQLHLKKWIQYKYTLTITSKKMDSIQ